jgi:hypothetical protein
MSHTFPVRFGLVEEVDDFEVLGVLLRERVNIFTHENVFFRNVREEEFEFRGVERAGKRVVDDLVKRGAVIICEKMGENGLG